MPIRPGTSPALTCVCHHLTVEARHKATITSLCSLAVLPVRSSAPQFDSSRGAKLRTPRTDGLLTHFASPRGEKRRLASQLFPAETEVAQVPENRQGNLLLVEPLVREFAERGRLDLLDMAYDFVE